MLFEIQVGQTYQNWVVTNFFSNREQQSTALGLQLRYLPTFLKSVEFAGLFLPQGQDTFMFQVKADLGEGMDVYILQHIAGDCVEVPTVVRRKDSSEMVRTIPVRQAGKALALGLVRRLPDLRMFGCDYQRSNDYLLNVWNSHL